MNCSVNFNSFAHSFWRFKKRVNFFLNVNGFVQVFNMSFQSSLQHPLTTYITGNLYMLARCTFMPNNVKITVSLLFQLNFFWTWSCWFLTVIHILFSLIIIKTIWKQLMKKFEFNCCFVIDKEVFISILWLLYKVIYS